MVTCGICGKQTETFHGMKIHWAKLHMANGKVPIVCEAFEDQPQPLNAEQLEIMSVKSLLTETEWVGFVKGLAIMSVKRNANEAAKAYLRLLETN